MTDAATPTGPLFYKSTAVFDEHSLPAGLRRNHRTKAGTWGIIRVLSGQVRYVILNPLSETMLDPDHPGRVLPEQLHFVEPIGAVRMQIEFYDRNPGASVLILP